MKPPFDEWFKGEVRTMVNDASSKGLLPAFKDENSIDELVTQEINQMSNVSIIEALSEWMALPDEA
jgi:hypothetical protein